jgi:N-acylglucosamine 2-epimerase
LITQVHTRREKHAAFEFVLWDGTPAPGNWGRWVNPGHMIEAGIFMIHEGLYRNDSRVIEQGIELIGWGFELGWDKEFGGVYNDVDIENKPFPGANANVACSKLWWQHTEALYGTLLAYVLTGRQQFLDSHKKVHEYSFRRFADGEFGEWFALLDRRGNRINDAKGTARKSIFHLGRNLFYCWRLLERTLP